MSDQLPIRSYRLCFDLERRIHQVDRWRIPVPYGLPLRGIAYAALALGLLVIAGRLPLVGPLVTAVHPALRLVVAPIALAAVGVRVRIDGRSAHQHLVAVTRQLLAPDWVAGFRAIEGPGPAWLDDVELAGDGCGCRLRAGTLTGPCTLLVRYPVEARTRGRRLTLTQAGDRPLWRGKRIGVPARARVRVR